MKWMALGLLILSACNGNDAGLSATIPNSPSTSGPTDPGASPVPSPSPTAVVNACAYDDNTRDTHLTYRITTIYASGDEAVYCRAVNDGGAPYEATANYAAGSSGFADARCTPGPIWFFILHPDGTPAARNSAQNVTVNFLPSECATTYQ